MRIDGKKITSRILEDGSLEISIDHFPESNKREDKTENIKCCRNCQGLDNKEKKEYMIEPKFINKEENIMVDDLANIVAKINASFRKKHKDDVDAMIYCLLYGENFSSEIYDVHNWKYVKQIKDLQKENEELKKITQQINDCKLSKKEIEEIITFIDYSRRYFCDLKKFGLLSTEEYFMQLNTNKLLKEKIKKQSTLM